LTGSIENATLICPTVVILAVPIILTVGSSHDAFSIGSVKGGGWEQQSIILLISTTC
jgi:hypothetical protein